MRERETELTLDKWQEAFKKGEFNDSSFETQVDAGWYDWFCDNSELAEKTKRLGTVIARLLDSQRIKRDAVYVWFKNNCRIHIKSGETDLYDDFRLSDVNTNDVLYTVAYKSPYKDENHLWAVFAICETTPEQLNRVSRTLTHGRALKPYFFDSDDELVEWFNKV